MFDNTNLLKMKDDNSGVEFTFADEILQDYQNLFQRAFPNISVAPSTPQGQIISHLTEQDIATINAIQEILNYFWLGGSGEMLDTWAFNQYRATRKQGIFGDVLMELRGTPFKSIPKGFVVSDGTLNFVSEADIRLNADGIGSGTFIQSETSENVALANTITQIITPNVNVERVTNPNPSNPAILRESDSAFYRRCQQYGSLFKNSSFASIMANVAEINGVSKIGGYENFTNQRVEVRGFTLDPHSFVVIVRGGDNNEIAKTLSVAKPAGAGMMGDQEVTIMVLDKRITYKFQRPVNAPLKVSVTCKLNLNSPRNYENIVKSACIDYIQSLAIGADITQPALSRYIIQQSSGFEVIDVKFARKDDEYNYEPIELNLIELATLKESDISVLVKEN